MSDIQFHKALFLLLKSCTLRWVDRLTIDITFKNEIENQLKELNIRFESTPGILRLQVPINDIFIYANCQEFQRESFVNSKAQYLILSSEAGPISFIDGVTYINFSQVNNYFYFSNAFSYQRLKNFLKDKENICDEGIHLVDSCNMDIRKIILYSSGKYGGLTIRFGAEIPDFDPKVDYSCSIEKLEKSSCDDTNQFTIFLKNSIIEILTIYNETDRLAKLLENIDAILNKAQLNFEIYLSGLSIDKVRKDFLELKLKYFSSLSEILTKITQQVFALPIGIIATLIAIHNLGSNQLFLLFLSFIIVGMSVLIVILINIYYKDICNIKSQADLDFQSIRKNNFFVKNQEEFLYFMENWNQLKAKLISLNSYLIWYYFFFNLSSIVIIGILANALLFKISLIFIIIIALLLIITIAYTYIFKEKDVFDF